MNLRPQELLIVGPIIKKLSSNHRMRNNAQRPEPKVYEQTGKVLISVVDTAMSATTIKT